MSKLNDEYYRKAQIVNMITTIISAIAFGFSLAIALIEYGVIK